MDDDVVAGLRILLIGEGGEAAESLRRELTSAGAASVQVAAAVERSAAGPPDLVVALDDAHVRAVQAQLDPLDLGAGPPVVALAEARGAGRRLAVVLEQRRLRARVAGLEAMVAEQALSAFRETEAARIDTLHRLAIAAGYRDDNTPEHTQRVGALAARLARELGIGERTVGLIRHAAPLHDLGKIAIPDDLLLKRGRLEPEEFEVVKTHAEAGARVLSGGGSEVLELAEQVAGSHHERWDGGGYPDGLAGTAIPLAARLVHVADAFDVLVHERPYKEAWSVQQAAAEIRANAGTQFDPDVAAAFDAIGAGSWSAALESS